MSVLGTSERPLRVAIVGSGPSGFYTAEALLKQEINIKVDMFDKLPVPFGLVRYGVAPDHPKIKNVTKVFEKTASNPRFSFFGNVTVGKNISVFELNQFYFRRAWGMTAKVSALPDSRVAGVPHALRRGKKSAP